MKEEVIKRRIFGLDVHPGCFTAASFYKDSGGVREAKPLLLQDKIPMERFDSWLLKHTNRNDILVMEALGISFNLVKRIEKEGRVGIVLDSFQVGKMGKTYLKNDKVDAVKIAKVYLAGFEENVWVPDPKTQERREILFAYRNAIKDVTRVSCRIWAFLTQNGIVVTKSIKQRYKNDPEKLVEIKGWSNS